MEVVAKIIIHQAAGRGAIPIKSSPVANSSGGIAIVFVAGRGLGLDAPALVVVHARHHVGTEVPTLVIGSINAVNVGVVAIVVVLSSGRDEAQRVVVDGDGIGLDIRLVGVVQQDTGPVAPRVVRVGA